MRILPHDPHFRLGEPVLQFKERDRIQPADLGVDFHEGKSRAVFRKERIEAALTDKIVKEQAFADGCLRYDLVCTGMFEAVPRKNLERSVDHIVLFGLAQIPEFFVQFRVLPGRESSSFIMIALRCGRFKK